VEQTLLLKLYAWAYKGCGDEHEGMEVKWKRDRCYPYLYGSLKLMSRYDVCETQDEVTCFEIPGWCQCCTIK
jgi:hypothetical protein